MNARSARLIIEYLEALLRQLAPNQETRARRLAQISKDGPSIAAHEIQLLIEQLEGYLYNPLHTPSLQDLPMEKLNWIRKNSTRRNV
jgi:hypothetical protein